MADQPVSGMRLWILRPIVGELADDNPWDPWYDKAFGMVVRAETPDQARAVAAKECADEGAEAWLREDYSSCLELVAEGEAGVIIQDVHSA